VVIELEKWCKRVEGRKTEWQRNDGFDNYQLKEGVFVFLLDNGKLSETDTLSPLIGMLESRR
jgi:hypothetical protein